ncbi:type II secretion system F family protein [Robertmurraya sp. FSL W8-0741]|uniref:type II secretion system F family protein n=1 Tax=Robertmurraya TaxID=2837507 RepID=UPI0010F5619D|nr:type II secretion system F family protein [Robertmurraya siralis]
MIISILYSLAVLFALWSAYNLLGYRASKKEWGNRVSKWFGSRNTRKSFILILGDKFDETKYGKKTNLQLKRANIQLMPSEFYGILLLGVSVTALLLNSFFSIKFPINLIISIVLMEMVRRGLFLIRKNKFQERMNDQLPEICRILANSTRSGMTLTQGIGICAQELNEPAKDEFRRLYGELQLGVDFNRALKNLERRIPSREFKLFIASLLIQKHAGGNMHAVLDEMGQTLEERKLLLQEIKTMTAEQRYIAYIVPVLPIFLLLIMNNLVDGFLDPLFSGIGIILLGLFVIGTLLSFFLVKKVTDIRV